MKAWEFKKGYEVSDESQHETNDEYTAFLNFLQAKKRVIEEDHEDIAEQFNWRERAAQFDQHKAVQLYDKSGLLSQKGHRNELLKFLESQKAQAEETHSIAQRIHAVVANRLERAELRGEEIPLELIPAFMRASTVVSEESRKAWGASLGVTRMIEYIDTSIGEDEIVKEVQVSEVIDENKDVDYMEVDIPCDE